VEGLLVGVDTSVVARGGLIPVVVAPGEYSREPDVLSWSEVGFELIAELSLIKFNFGPIPPGQAL
jgi:hypothetical protein